MHIKNKLKVTCKGQGFMFMCGFCPNQGVVARTFLLVGAELRPAPSAVRNSKRNQWDFSIGRLNLRVAHMAAGVVQLVWLLVAAR